MPINVRVDLGNVRFRRKAEAPFSVNAEPYLWTVFFKIDDGDGSGQPIATVMGTPGSHGNLGVGTVRPPSVIRVPRSIGRWDTGLIPLPNQAGTVNGLVRAVVGVVAILMEEDNVSDDGAEAGRRELTKQVQKAIDGIAADLVSALTFNEDAFAATIRSKVADAIQAEQNFLEDIWSFLDKDDFVGSMVWHTLYNDLEDASAPLTFSEVWEGSFADWSLDGQATTFVESRPRFSRTALNFGSVRAGLMSSRSFTISNYTSADLTLTLAKTGSARFRVNTSSVEVPRSESATVVVQFFPIGPGSVSGSIDVRRQGSSASLATISLNGSTPSGPAP